MVELKIIVEVGRESRVYCQAQGCGRTVYKEIHVIVDHGKIILLGKQCYSKLLGHQKLQPTCQHNASHARKLTEQEVLQLINNTENFIAILEEAYQHEIDLLNRRKITVEQKKDDSNDTLDCNPLIQTLDPFPLVAREIQPNENITNKNMLHWMWARDRQRFNKLIGQYRQNEQRDRNTDIVLRYVNDALLNDPFTYSLRLQKLTGLSQQLIYETWKRFSIIELMPQYVNGENTEY